MAVQSMDTTLLAIICVAVLYITTLGMYNILKRTPGAILTTIPLITSITSYHLCEPATKNHVLPAVYASVVWLTSRIPNILSSDTLIHIVTLSTASTQLPASFKSETLTNATYIVLYASIGFLAKKFLTWLSDGKLRLTDLIALVLGYLVTLLSIGGPLQLDQVALLIHVFFFSKSLICWTARNKTRVCMLLVIVLGIACVALAVLTAHNLSETASPTKDSIMQKICLSLPEQVPRWKEKIKIEEFEVEIPQIPIKKTFWSWLFGKELPAAPPKFERRLRAFWVEVPIILTCSERLTEDFGLANFDPMSPFSYVNLLEKAHSFGLLSLPMVRYTTSRVFYCCLALVSLSLRQFYGRGYSKIVNGAVFFIDWQSINLRQGYAWGYSKTTTFFSGMSQVLYHIILDYVKPTIIALVITPLTWTMTLICWFLKPYVFIPVIGAQCLYIKGKIYIAHSRFPQTWRMFLYNEIYDKISVGTSLYLAEIWMTISASGSLSYLFCGAPVFFAWAWLNAYTSFYTAILWTGNLWIMFSLTLISVIAKLKEEADKERNEADKERNEADEQRKRAKSKEDSFATLSAEKRKMSSQHQKDLKKQEKEITSLQKQIKDLNATHKQNIEKRDAEYNTLKRAQTQLEQQNELNRKTYFDEWDADKKSRLEILNELSEAQNRNGNLRRQIEHYEVMFDGMQNELIEKRKELLYQQGKSCDLMLDLRKAKREHTEELEKLLSQNPPSNEISEIVSIRDENRTIEEEFIRGEILCLLAEADLRATAPQTIPCAKNKATNSSEVAIEDEKKIIEETFMQGEILYLRTEASFPVTTSKAVSCTEKKLTEASKPFECLTQITAQQTVPGIKEKLAKASGISVLPIDSLQPEAKVDARLENDLSKKDVSVQKFSEKKAAEKTTTKRLSGEEQFSRDFPGNNYEIVLTPSTGWQCGMYAMISSMEYQGCHFGLRAPSEQEMRMILHNGKAAQAEREVRESIGASNNPQELQTLGFNHPLDVNFSIDRLAGALEEWGAKYGYRLKLGVHLSAGKSFVVFTGDDDAENKIIWIDNDEAENVRSGVLGHYSGMRKKEVELTQHSVQASNSILATGLPNGPETTQQGSDAAPVDVSMPSTTQSSNAKIATKPADTDIFTGKSFDFKVPGDFLPELQFPEASPVADLPVNTQSPVIHVFAPAAPSTSTPAADIPLTVLPAGQKSLPTIFAPLAPPLAPPSTSAPLFSTSSSGSIFSKLAPLASTQINFDFSGAHAAYNMASQTVSTTGVTNRNDEDGIKYESTADAEMEDDQHGSIVQSNQPAADAEMQDNIYGTVVENNEQLVDAEMGDDQNGTIVHSTPNNQPVDATTAEITMEDDATPDVVSETTANMTSNSLSTFSFGQFDFPSAFSFGQPSVEHQQNTMLGGYVFGDTSNIEDQSSTTVQGSFDAPGLTNFGESRSHLYSEPVSQGPESQSHLYFEPASQGPETQSHLYSEPVSQGPETQSHLYSEPVSQGPESQSHLYSEPASQGPETQSHLYSESVSQGPESQPPIYSEPVSQGPETQPPIYSESVSQGPESQPPIYSESVSQGPESQPPIYSESVSQGPESQPPIYSESVSQGPESQPPIYSEPVFQESVSREPVVEPPLTTPPSVDTSSRRILKIFNPSPEEKLKYYRLIKLLPEDLRIRAISELGLAGIVEDNDFLTVSNLKLRRVRRTLQDFYNDGGVIYGYDGDYDELLTDILKLLHDGYEGEAYFTIDPAPCDEEEDMTLERELEALFAQDVSFSGSEGQESSPGVGCEDESNDDRDDGSVETPQDAPVFRPRSMPKLQFSDQDKIDILKRIQQIVPSEIQDSFIKQLWDGNPSDLTSSTIVSVLNTRFRGMRRRLDAHFNRELTASTLAPTQQHTTLTQENHGGVVDNYDHANFYAADAAAEPSPDSSAEHDSKILPALSPLIYDEEGNVIDGESDDLYSDSGNNNNLEPVFDLDGYDQSGFDENGYDRSGYDRSGFNSNGFNSEGFNSNGFDVDEYDKDGYNPEGIDRDGFSKEEAATLREEVEYWEKFN